MTIDRDTSRYSNRLDTETRREMLDNLLHGGKLNKESVDQLLEEKRSALQKATDEVENFKYPPVYNPGPMDVELPGTQLQMNQANLRRQVKALEHILNNL